MTQTVKSRVESELLLQLTELEPTCEIAADLHLDESTNSRPTHESAEFDVVRIDSPLKIWGTLPSYGVTSFCTIWTFLGDLGVFRVVTRVIVSSQLGTQLIRCLRSRDSAALACALKLRLAARALVSGSHRSDADGCDVIYLICWIAVGQYVVHDPASELCGRRWAACGAIPETLRTIAVIALS